MRLPDLVAYQAAVQHPSTAFADPQLKSATVATNRLGLPRAVAGNFAVTYELRSGLCQWAVRCFHRDADDRAARYAAISRELTQPNQGALLNIQYQQAGVRVGADWYPITKMPWVDGRPLNAVVEDRLGQADRLRALERAFTSVLLELRKRGIAHGDLQHGNILVDASGTLRLVDYDGMFVPALRGRAASESGDPNYQHPQRSSQFDADLDRFAAIVIVLALRALMTEPALWRAYNTGDNLLFRRADFANPSRSALFRDLSAIPSVRPFAERLARISEAEYAAIPPLDSVFHTTRPAVAKAKTPRSWKIHRATVQTAVAVSPDAVITADSTGMVCVRSLSSGCTDRTMRVADLRAVAMRANGALQVVTSSGPRLLMGGRELIGGVRAVRVAALSPNAEWLAAIGDDHLLRIWKIDTTRACAAFDVPAARSMAVSDDGRIALAGARGSSVMLWSARGPQRATNLEIGRGRITCLAFSCDGQRLAAGTTAGLLTVWNLASGQLAYNPLDLGSAVMAVALSRDGSAGLASTHDGCIYLRHFRGVPKKAPPPRAPDPLRIVRIFDWLRRVALL